jgi:hypothetical protein
MEKIVWLEYNLENNSIHEKAVIDSKENRKILDEVEQWIGDKEGVFQAFSGPSFVDGKWSSVTPAIWLIVEAGLDLSIPSSIRRQVVVMVTSAPLLAENDKSEL